MRHDLMIIENIGEGIERRFISRGTEQGIRRCRIWAKASMSERRDMATEHLLAAELAAVQGWIWRIRIEAGRGQAIGGRH